MKIALLVNSMVDKPIAPLTWPSSHGHYKPRIGTPAASATHRRRTRNTHVYLCRMMWSAVLFRRLEPFRRESRVWETDGETNGRTDFTVANAAL